MIVNVGDTVGVADSVRVAVADCVSDVLADNDRVSVWRVMVIDGVNEPLAVTDEVRDTDRLLEGVRELDDVTVDEGVRVVVIVDDDVVVALADDVGESVAVIVHDVL